MKKKLPWLVISVAAIEAAPIPPFLALPRHCQCEEVPRIVPVPVEFPQPEERPVFPSLVTEPVSSAASSGAVVVNPGTGGLKIEGFAPTVSVSSRG